MRGGKVRGLYAIVDSEWVKLTDAGRYADELVSSGAGVIQLRAKGCASAQVLEAALAMKKAASGRALFIVNDRVDIALLSGADGVHLGQSDIPLIEARRLMPNGTIGVSTHNLEEAKEADALGADYISFGPIFATKTKKDADTPKGLDYLREAASSVKVPIAAIGGITADSADSVIASGASAVAVISDILLSADIKARAARIISLADAALAKRG